MKPFDLTKFKNATTKTLKTVGTGFRDPSFWIDSGNYVLNYITSGDFHKGFPLDGKFNLLVGPSGTGKSLLSIGVMGKYAQDNGVQIILLDTENAVDKKWSENFGLDLDESKILRFSVSTLDDIAAIISGFIEQYKAAYDSVPYEERQKILFIIDSLGMTTTKVEQDQFSEGDMKGDMGRKPKQLFSLCRNFLASCSDEPIGVIATNHTYASQSIFKPEDVIAGGGCLIKETKVLTPDGEKSIEDFVVGDVVKTRYGNKEVTNTFHYIKDGYKLTLSDGLEVTCSNEHKFWSESTTKSSHWVRADELDEGDDLAKSDESVVQIVKKEPVKDIDVYDIEVDEVHHYLLSNGLVSHNSMEYAPSIIVALQKSKLKDEDNKDKTKKKDILGIQVDATCRKTRYTKPFQKATFNIPWDSGLQRYSGLFELFTETLRYKGNPVIVKSGAYCAYYDLKTGEQVFNKFRKDISEDDYDRIMKDWEQIVANDSENIDSTNINEPSEDDEEK